MHNIDLAARPLNFKVNLSELEDYYETLKNNYSHLHWSWDKNHIHLGKDALSVCTNEKETLMHGWSLQSNMADINIPPSMLKSKHASVPWYDTELVFGVVARLKKAIPFAYRWTLFVLPPTATVVKHTDQGEYAIHIPIQWDNKSVFILGDEPNTKIFTFPADGNAYLVDAEIPHATANNSTVDRVGLVCRIKRNNLEELLNITGEI